MSKTSNILFAALAAARLGGRTAKKSKIAGAIFGGIIGAGFAAFVGMRSEDFEYPAENEADPNVGESGLLSALGNFAPSLIVPFGVMIQAFREIDGPHEGLGNAEAEDMDDLQEETERLFSSTFCGAPGGAENHQEVTAAAKQFSSAIGKALSADGIPTTVSPSAGRDLPFIAARIGAKLVQRDPELLPKFQNLRGVWRREQRPKLHCDTLDHVVNGMHWNA